MSSNEKPEAYGAALTHNWPLIHFECWPLSETGHGAAPEPLQRRKRALRDFSRMFFISVCHGVALPPPPAYDGKAYPNQ
jgi:hypothetical protein